MKLSDPLQRKLFTAAAISLFVVLLLELTFTMRRETQTWDEACHIFAGYRYWTRADFAMNPEHPPFVKLLAGATLLPLHLNGPKRKGLFSKEADFLSATEFVYSNNAEQILLRTRTAVSLLCLLLAALVFAAARCRPCNGRKSVCRSPSKQRTAWLYGSAGIPDGSNMSGTEESVAP